NVMERAALLCVGSRVTVEHLPMEKMKATFTSVEEPAPPPKRAPSGEMTTLDRELPPPAPTSNMRAELDALERKRILDALAQCAGNQTKAAKMLGMSRRTLLHRLDSYGVARPRKGVG